MNRPAEVPPEPLIEMIRGTVPAQVASFFARLRLADHLKDGPRAVSDLAKSAGCQEDSLHRLLRTAAALGLVSESGPRTFALSPMGEWLRSDRRDSLIGFATFAG